MDFRAPVILSEAHRGPRRQVFVAGVGSGVGVPTDWSSSGGGESKNLRLVFCGMAGIPTKFRSTLFPKMLLYHDHVFSKHLFHHLGAPGLDFETGAAGKGG